MTDITKKLRERWGRTFVDKRDWHTYNEQLVTRGEFLLDLGWVENWHFELEQMNEGKVGRPYLFPKSLIEFQGVLHAKKINYRMIEGMTKKLCEIGQLPDYNDHSSVNRRVNQLNLKLDVPESNDLVLFSDGTSCQAVAGGEYLRDKYGKKNRRWVQIVILGDPKTKEPVSFEVNVIQESEADSTRRQIERLKEDGVCIAAVGGDGAMDSMNLWNFLQQEKIEPIIKPDKNAKDDTANELRNRVVKERNSIGYKNWSRKNRYGFRWPATEGIHSAFKRIFGEQLSATSEKGMLQEAGIKVWAYQRIKRYGEA